MTIPGHLFLSKKISLSRSILLGMLILSATPTIVGLDRGNLIILCMPLLYFFLHYEREGNSKRSVFFWVALLLIKPHFALFGVIFFRNANLIAALKRYTLGFALFSGSFLIYPSELVVNIKAYYRQLVGYQDYATLGNVFPVNISLGNALSLVDVFHGTTFASGVKVLGLVFLIVTLVIVYRSPAKLSSSNVLPTLMLPIILPQTTFHYYLVVLVVFFIFAIINTVDSSLERNIVENRLHNYSQIGLSVWAGILFAPWAFSWIIFSPVGSYFATSVISMHWLLVIWSLPVCLVGSLLYLEISKRGNLRAKKISSSIH
jgi:hypothetical protein